MHSGITEETCVYHTYAVSYAILTDQNLQIPHEAK